MIPISSADSPRVLTDERRRWWVGRERPADDEEHVSIEETDELSEMQEKVESTELKEEIDREEMELLLM